MEFTEKTSEPYKYSSTNDGMLSDKNYINMLDYFDTFNEYNTESDVWQDFGPPLSMRIIYTIIGVIGFVDNAFVIIVIITNKYLRNKTTNMYILNQSVIDLLASGFLVAFYNSPDLKVNDTWLADAGCRIWTAKIPLWSLFLASTYNLVVMTVEKRQDLSNPMGHRKSFSKAKMYSSLVFPYIFGFAIQAATSMPPTFVLDDICTYFWQDGLAGRAVGFFVIIIQWLIPVMVFIVSYASIITMLYHQLTNGVGESNKSRDRIYQRGVRNTIKMLILVAVLFIICWSPNIFIILLFNCNFTIDFSSVYYHVSGALVAANCIVNPIIYCLQYQQFRSAAFVCCPRWRDDISQATETSMTEMPSRVQTVAK